MSLAIDTRNTIRSDEIKISYLGYRPPDPIFILTCARILMEFIYK